MAAGTQTCMAVEWSYPVVCVSAFAGDKMKATRNWTDPAQMCVYVCVVFSKEHMILALTHEHVQLLCEFGKSASKLCINCIITSVFYASCGCLLLFANISMKC